MSTTAASETPHASSAYHQRVADLVTAIGTDQHEGLSDEEASSRLKRYGRNELAAEKPVPAWRRFLAQYQDVLVILLLVATAISAGLWAFERDAALPYEALAIFTVVLLNATMGYIQESKAEAAVAALRSMSAADAAVIRGGERRGIPATEIVPGDLILVQEGDTIPADARLIESAALQTAEAALTGESLPVTKGTAPIAEEVPLGDRDNMVFSGTAVTYGHGKAIVIATGMRTEMGRIAGLLKRTSQESTPLQRELDRTGKILGFVVIAIAVVMIVTIILVEHVRGAAALFDVLILGVALAVAAVPEGLPAVVTAVLSIGVQRMARRNAIVRHLAAVETLGSATVIASDKTGTLTKNEMTVRVIVTASGRVTFEGSGYAPALKRADIGVAMGITGTDVSKEAADMVLADDNFASIVAAVEEGRAIFANIRKFLRYLLSSNIGEVMAMFFGVLLAEQIGLDISGDAVVLPLLATQILWINLVTDGPPALALGVDPADEGLMEQPPRPLGEGVLTPRMWRGIVFVGAVMAAGTLFVLDAALPGGFVEGSGDLRYAQTMGFTTLMLFQIFNVVNARSDDRSAFVHLFTNGWLWAAIGGSLALQVLVVHAPFLQRAFGTVGLSSGDWVFCVVVASSVLWLREGSKLIVRTTA